MNMVGFKINQTKCAYKKETTCNETQAIAEHNTGNDQMLDEPLKEIETPKNCSEEPVEAEVTILHVFTWEECQKHCQLEATCNFFDFAVDERKCPLKPDVREEDNPS